MITYKALCNYPGVFSSLTGLTRDAFDHLHEQFVEVDAKGRAGTPTKRDKKPRQRAAGAGRHYRHDSQTRLLMALMWLRIYPTVEVLGFFFSLHKTNAALNVHAVLDTLEQNTLFVCERPAQKREQLRSVQAVMDAFPDVRLIIDAKEQRVRRPSGTDKSGQSRQKPFYSGKKKTHTVKTQVSVSPNGAFQSISESVPGSMHDLSLLRQTGLLHRLNANEAAMLDKGYDGIKGDWPQRTCYLPYKARRGQPLTQEQKEYNRHIAKYRIVVEHSFAQVGAFQSLSQVFRHDISRHNQLFRIVAHLVNQRIEHRPLKTYQQA
jgi:hypothetical protein